MNLPNKITIARIFLVPFFIGIFLLPQIPYNNYIALALFVIASATDAVDGYIARKYKLVTDFGKFMDPLADKLLVCSALICFVEIDGIYMPAWIAIILIAREFIISGFRLVAADKGVVIAAGIWGKLKTICQMIMCIVLMLQIPGGFFDVLGKVLVYLSLALTIISLADYIWKNRAVLEDEK